MNFKNNLFGIAAMALCLGLASCSDDDELQYSQAQVTNSELKTILEQNGLHFDDQGHLLLDEAANNLKALDLSGKKISDYKELKVLPNLVELNLSNNEFGPTFDFSIPPAQITAVDLTGNEIYDFPGLVNIETDEFGNETATVLRKLTKLYLPEMAKYNCNEIVAFYQNASSADIQMEDASGNLAKYTTLREVPDEKWRSILHNLFGSMFEGEYINIAKRLVIPKECQQNLTTIDVKNRTMTVGNIEGFQYIANNKGYKGTMLQMYTDDKCEISYFPIPASTFALQLDNVSTPNNFDTRNIKNLCYVDIEHNDGVEVFDFSKSTTFGQRGDDGGGAPEFIDYFLLCRSNNLKEIHFPDQAKHASEIRMIDCPKLEKVNLQHFETINNLRLALLPSESEIVYPELKRLNSNGWRCLFAIDEGMYNKQATKDFIQEYYVEKDLIQGGMIPYEYEGAKEYKWQKNYNK